MAYTAITLATLRQELQDKYESLPLWTVTEANNAINESLRRWNMLTGQWKQKVVLNTTQVNGIPTVWYALPGSLVYNMRVEWNEYPVEQTSIGDLDYGHSTWEGETTKTLNVPTRPSLCAPAGLQMIAIWPADATLPNSLTIDGIARTPALVNDTDFVDLGQDEHHALLSEALHISLFKGARQWLAASQAQHKMFLQGAAAKNERLKASTWFRKAMGLDLNRGQRPMRIPMAPPPQQQGPPQGQGA
jgi:hypothetical protein